MRLVAGLLCLGLLGVAVADASAESISAFTDTVGASSPTQLGRPARYGLPQDWAGVEPYPGLAPGTETSVYHYKTYDFAASILSQTPYVEITALDITQQNDVFVSAYEGSYDPSSPAINWLGDAGASYFVPGVASAFEVLLTGGSNLVLVAETADADNVRNGSDDPYTITVDAYADSSYDDPVVTPEPGSLALLATGLLGLTAGVRSRRAHPW